MNSFGLLTEETCRVFKVPSGHNSKRQLQERRWGEQRQCPKSFCIRPIPSFSAVHFHKQKKRINAATLTKLQRVYYQLFCSAMSSNETGSIAKGQIECGAPAVVATGSCMKAVFRRSLTDAPQRFVGTSTPGFGVLFRLWSKHCKWFQSQCASWPARRGIYSNPAPPLALVGMRGSHTEVNETQGGEGERVGEG